MVRTVKCGVSSVKCRVWSVPEKGGTKASSHNENPCAQQIACKTFNIEILQFWRSPNCTERFEADILKLCWWLTYLQPLEQYIFLHLFVSLARNRTEGGTIPYCSKLPAQNTFKTGVLLLEQAGKHHQLKALDFLRGTPSKLEFSSCSKPASPYTPNMVPT